MLMILQLIPQIGSVTIRLQYEVGIQAIGIAVSARNGVSWARAVLPG